jgi:hypothetical protein
MRTWEVEEVLKMLLKALIPGLGELGLEDLKMMTKRRRMSCNPRELERNDVKEGGGGRPS